MKKNNNPTMTIKCKFSNAVHKILEPNINIKRNQRWLKVNQEKYKFTDEQLFEMIEKIIKLHDECSKELSKYQFERREKRRIHKARIERGYKFKKKTKKEDYEKKFVETN